MAVGDVNSDAPGSGARYNDNKLQMDLIPVRFWVSHWGAKLDAYPKLQDLLISLADFQEGNDQALDHLLEDQEMELMIFTTRVLEFGAKKYAAWNWAKGMDWSIPIGCILRHSAAIVDKGEMADPESQWPHYSHVVCNIIMLLWFRDYYPEGDDRPPTYKIDKPEIPRCPYEPGVVNLVTQNG